MSREDQVIHTTALAADYTIEVKPSVIVHITASADQNFFHAEIIELDNHPLNDGTICRLLGEGWRTVSDPSNRDEMRKVYPEADLVSLIQDCCPELTAGACQRLAANAFYNWVA